METLNAKRFENFECSFATILDNAGSTPPTSNNSVSRSLSSDPQSREALVLELTREWSEELFDG
jgi:hypothetical protein